MENHPLFNRTVSLLSRVLDLRARNHKVIVSNIANADTPDYKEFKMHVEEALKKHAGTQNHLRLQRTRSTHLPIGHHDTAGARVTREPETPMSLRTDGNTVDPDRSMSRLAENNLLYNAAAQILNRKLQGLKAAIQGGSGGK